VNRLLDLALLALFLLSLALVILGNEDPFARDAVCNGLGFCPKSDHAKAWNKAFYEVGIGGLVSLIFYWLLVRLPENEKRQRIKKSLEHQYRLFKKDCISIILGVVEGRYDLDEVDALLDQKNFREYFVQKVSNSQDKWHAFQNKIDEHSLRELLTAMEIFRDEISFVLNNTYIPKDEPFEFFKRMSNIIYSLKDAPLEDDPTKRLSRFLWSLLSGFDFVTGYRQEDIVQQMIRSI
jgi:hypothetical protein